MDPISQAVAATPPAPADLWQAARQRHQAGDLAGAEALCLRVLQINGAHAEAVHLLGVIAFSAGLYGRAIESFRRAAELTPGEASFHSNLGLACQEAGRLQEAISCFREALRLSPEYAGAHCNLGRALAAQGRLDEAAECYRSALRCQPGFAEAHNNLGTALRDLGRLPEAERHFREALRLQPRLAAAHNNLGLILGAQGNWEEAASCFREALRLRKDDAEAWVHLAGALRRQGQLEEAAGCYHQVLTARPDSAEAHLGLGHVLRDQKRLDGAIACYQQALRLKPDLAEAHNSLGIAYRTQGRFDESVASLLHALRLLPNAAPVHNNLGITLAAQGRLDEAAYCYEQALRLQSDYFEARSNLGNLLLRQGKPAAAAACFEEAVRLRPESPAAHVLLGNAYKDLDRPDDAVACYRRALALDPASADAHNNLGTVLLERKEVEEALACCEEARRLQPENPAAHLNLGNVLMERHEVDRAVACYEEAVRLKPDLAVGHGNLGYAYTVQGDPERALAACEQALRLQPGSSRALHNQSIALLALGEPDQALACSERALQHDPAHADAHLCRALIRLQAGRCADGWREYEWRWKAKKMSPRPFPQPLWDGAPFGGGRLLVHCEQGLGDTLQFVRYLPLVKERGGEVILECQAPLAALLSRCGGFDRLVPRGTELPPFDLQIPLLSLPWAFGTPLESVPADVPYLFADGERVEWWRRELDAAPGFKVGIAWQGSRTFGGDRLRSAPLAQFAPLAEVEGVRLVSLQKGPGSEQLPDFRRRAPVIDLGPRLDEEAGAFMDTAAVMRSLDLVITTDTSIAHLAGGLGVPVWVALCVGPDWRWLRGRDDSPWYPTMRLFRQARVRDWSGVFERMAAELEGRVSAAARAGRSVRVEISPGELVDKITILEIKSERLTDPGQLANVRRELCGLAAARDRGLDASDELGRLAAQLKAVNEALWRVEDEIRLCERDGDFGHRFVELARSVYRHNDRRAALKRRINDLSGSSLVEEKSYASYAGDER